MKNIPVTGVDDVIDEESRDADAEAAVWLASGCTCGGNSRLFFFFLRLDPAVVRSHLRRTVELASLADDLDTRVMTRQTNHMT